MYILMQTRKITTLHLIIHAVLIHTYSSKQSRGAGGRFGSIGRKQMKCYIPFEVKCKCGETRSITTEAEFIDLVGYVNAVAKKKN